jgi:hypothetical protein
MTVETVFVAVAAFAGLLYVLAQIGIAGVW